MIGWSWHSQKPDENYGGYLQIFVQQRTSTKTTRTARLDMLLETGVYSHRIPNDHEIQKWPDLQLFH